jgi:hypothetical protein
MRLENRQMTTSKPGSHYWDKTAVTGQPNTGVEAGSVSTATKRDTWQKIVEAKMPESVVTGKTDGAMTGWDSTIRKETTNTKPTAVVVA